MTEPAPACPAHRELVSEATGPDPSDAALERYAVEVPTCASCRRALAVSLGVHPAVLDRAGRATPQEMPAGMSALREALGSVSGPEGMAPPRPARPLRWTAAVAVSLALAAGMLWVTWPAAAPPEPMPAPLPVAVQPVHPPPVPAPPVPLIAPPDAGPAAPAPARPALEREPARVVAAPAPPAPAPPALPAGDDAIAAADDWPAPPFEDLRAGTPKSASAAIRALQLVITGGGGARQVGDTVGLTVVSSAEASFAVCVTGPERGVVWRGAVPPGRTELSRTGRPQSFAFGAPGTYRFAVGAADLDRCADPVHVVEVEVGR